MTNKNFKILSFLVVAVLLNSCIYSVHPLASEDVTFDDKRIEGRWSEKDSEHIWWEFTKQVKEDGKVEKIEERGIYALTYSEEGNVQMFACALIELGGNFFLDIYPLDDSKLGNKLLERTLFPTHLFYKIEFEDNMIKVWPFDYDWLDKLFKDSRIRLAHEDADAGILLTASTEELQKFIIKYGDNKEAYDHPMVLNSVAKP